MPISFQSFPSYWDRVPGCMADVRIGTRIIEQIDSFGNKVEVVRVHGIADSKVAQGMLALLSKVALNLLYIYHNATTE